MKINKILPAVIIAIMAFALTLVTVMAQEAKSREDSRPGSCPHPAKAGEWPGGLHHNFNYATHCKAGSWGHYRYSEEISIMVFTPAALPVCS